MEKINNKINKLISCSFTIQLFVLLFLPPVNGKTDWLRFVMYSFFAIISLIIVGAYIIKAVINKKIYITKVGFCILLFYCLCLISIVWGITQGVPINDCVRGILPFAWLIYVLILSHPDFHKYIPRWFCVLGILALIYSLRIFIYYVIYCVGNPNERVTFHLFQATSIIPMLGVLLFMYFFVVGESKKPLCYLAMLFCLIAVLMTQTKSMIIALVMGIFTLTFVLFRCYKKKQGKKKKLLNIALISTLLCVFVTIFSTSLGDRWKNAIKFSDENMETEKNTDTNTDTNTNTDIKEETTLPNVSETTPQIVVVDAGSVSVRIIEIRTAIQKLKESPVLGKGLGYRWTAVGVDYGEPVIYMHNIVAFFMVDFGLLGIMYLLAMIILIIWFYIKVQNNMALNVKDKEKIYLCISMLILMFVYANFFAVYRTIEFVVILALVLCSLTIVESDGLV